MLNRSTFRVSYNKEVNDTTLQIVISLINDAASQLTEVSDQLASLGTTADEASAQITNSLTDAEQAVAEAAVTAANAWADSFDAIPGVTEDAYNAISEQWLGISESASTAASTATESWQNSLSELEDSMAQATTTIEEDFAAMNNAAGASASSSGGSFGYFHNLILGMLAERVGSGISGAVHDVISAASGMPNQIAQLTAQIQQQQAAIHVNEAALLRWNGTTAQVQAAHQKATADIEAERVKIAELTRELGPLEAAQQAAGNSAQQYNSALLQLQTNWQVLLATIGGPFIAAATSQILYIDEIVKKMQAWAAEHPLLAKEIMTFLAILGPALTLLGEFAIGWAILSLALTSTVGPFILLGAVIAIVAAALIAFWPQIKQLFDYLNGKDGIVNALRVSWNQLSSEFTAHLLPDLEKLWKDLQPLMPFLEAFAALVGGALLTAILALANGLIQVVDAFVQLLDYATQVADFLASRLEPILNTVKSLVDEFSASGARHAVGNAAPSLMSAIGGTILSLVPGFATGGIVNGPTLAMVGEAGPEAIIPLSAFTGGSSLAAMGAGGGGGNIIVNINGGSYLNQGGAQQIAEALATMIGRQIKLKNYA